MKSPCDLRFAGSCVSEQEHVALSGRCLQNFIEQLAHRTLLDMNNSCKLWDI